MPLKDLLDFEPGSREAFEKLWLGYTESLGHPELRAQIAKLYRTAGAEHVLVHAGAQEAIFNFANACLKPSDHVIVHWPCYQSHYQIAETLGCEITKWEDPSPESLKGALRKNTKAVFLNLPHNPTGYQMEADALTQVASLCHEHGAWLFLDEVYRGLEYDGISLPAGCDLSPSAISLGVMSKSFGLPGLRIGWIATKNQDVYRAMAAYKDYTTICNSAPSEFLTTLALRHVDRLLEKNLTLIKTNLVAVEAFFTRFEKHFEWEKPRAGCLSFPRLRGNVSATKFCDEVLRTTGVLLAPSSEFNYGDRHFRIGFGRAGCLAALERLSAALDAGKIESLYG